jgi:hypothetical protein
MRMPANDALVVDLPELLDKVRRKFRMLAGGQ